MPVNGAVTFSAARHELHLFDKATGKRIEF